MGQGICPLLTARTGVPVEPGRTLLFLDEVQEAPDVLTCVRYFREEMPTLHVVVAGSLLEIALERVRIPMPVGRVQFLFLEPMSFPEFLAARGRGARGVACGVAGRRRPSRRSPRRKPFRLLSLPFYMVPHWRRLAESVL